ncbi:hypothetical protein E2C01_035539 [Portunus trituberculatus]|uniref:Uncharacterized protein n=1 Tax=Portunus trituberculatus TaxID=210409 RepID=A0A5B7F9L8_PORTR|nr:hypothetical protein [Portunus trituberculatus]
MATCVGMRGDRPRTEPRGRGSLLACPGGPNSPADPGDLSLLLQGEGGVALVPSPKSQRPTNSLTCIDKLQDIYEGAVEVERWSNNLEDDVERARLRHLETRERRVEGEAEGGKEEGRSLAMRVEGRRKGRKKGWREEVNSYIVGITKGET